MPPSNRSRRTPPTTPTIASTGRSTDGPMRPPAVRPKIRAATPSWSSWRETVVAAALHLSQEGSCCRRARLVGQPAGPGQARKVAHAWALVQKRTARPVRLYPLPTAESTQRRASSSPSPAPCSHRRRGAMASVASSCCPCSSTVFACSVPVYRTRSPRLSLRPPLRRAATPPGRSVLRCLPEWGSDKLGTHGASDEKGAEPASRRRGRTGPLDASWGIAFAAAAGVLMLQGSQQALAGTQFMGLQAADVLGDLGDISTGFASAFLLIFFSELGDRTFFIAALLAARNSGAIIFLGTFGALAVMTIVSVVLGRAFHYVDGIIPFSFGGIDFPVDDFLAACLLVYYGITTLLDAASGDAEKMNEEQEEAELAVSKFSGNGAGIMSAASTVASTFVLVFIAEWGDKSFFSTIALAAASSPLGVIAGSLAGHALATLIAVLGGSLLGTFLSEKIIAYIGGSLFLAFAAVTLVEIVSS